MSNTTIIDHIPVVIWIPENWRDPVRYEIQESFEVCGIKIPRYFVTDGASVPRYLWPLFPPVGRYFRAASVHDLLLDQGVEWKVANRFFKRALIESNVPKWRRVLMVSGVGFHGFIKENFTADKRGVL